MYDFFISFKFLLGKVTAEYKTEKLPKYQQLT